MAEHLVLIIFIAINFFHRVQSYMLWDSDILF